jgi:hypothetical protein
MMAVRSTLVICTVAAFLGTAAPAPADGGMFYTEGQAADLAQTRQEALLAVHGTEVTYVLRTRYSAQAGELAWVLPVPATPTDVVAHEDDTLFRQLHDLTRPRFVVIQGFRPVGGCGCGAAPLANGGGGVESELVVVEASGQAGIFDWSALTATGGTAILDWLNDNGFSVPASAEVVLDSYIQQDMHFLAIRVREADDLSTNGTRDVPPIQFTVQTARRFYPMTISQISAANEVEVLIYVVADHRAEAINLPNGEIDPLSLIFDPESDSQTNYESLFAETLTDLGGLALITEYAAHYLVADGWPDAPAALEGQPSFLTRMRSLVPRDRMDRDFEFGDAPEDVTIEPPFVIEALAETSVVAVVKEPLAALLVLGLFNNFVRRRRGRRKARGNALPVHTENAVRDYSTGLTP